MFSPPVGSFGATTVETSDRFLVFWLGNPNHETNIVP